MPLRLVMGWCCCHGPSRVPWGTCMGSTICLRKPTRPPGAPLFLSPLSLHMHAVGLCPRWFGKVLLAWSILGPTALDKRACGSANQPGRLGFKYHFPPHSQLVGCRAGLRGRPAAAETEPWVTGSPAVLKPGSVVSPGALSCKARYLGRPAAAGNARGLHLP